MLAFCLAVLGAGSMVGYHLGFFIPRVLEIRAAQGLDGGYSFGDDFYPVWLTARLWRTEHLNPYSAPMTRQIQAGLFGRALDPGRPHDPPVDYREFTYPAYTELLLWPASLVEFRELRPPLAALLTIITIASVWLWMKSLGWRVESVCIVIAGLLAIFNYPVLEALFALQPGLLAGFALAASAFAVSRGRLLLAGMLLGLTLIKPQMTLLLAAYWLLWAISHRSRFRLLGGFFGTAALLIVGSLVIWPHWIGQWLHILLGYHRYSTPALVILLPGSTLGSYLGPAAIVILFALGAALAWTKRLATSDSLDFWLASSLLLAITSVTLLPGQAIYDHVILLPGIFLLMLHRRQLWDTSALNRTLLVCGGVVLFWPWVAAFLLMAVRPLLTLPQFDAIFSLPIRTAASLPFAVLALLECARRANLSGNQAAV